MKTDIAHSPIARDEIVNRIRGLDEWEKHVALKQFKTTDLQDELRRREAEAGRKLDKVLDYIDRALALEDNLNNTEATLKGLRELLK